MVLILFHRIRCEVPSVDLKVIKTASTRRKSKLKYVQKGWPEAQQDLRDKLKNQD